MRFELRFSPTFTYYILAYHIPGHPLDGLDAWPACCMSFPGIGKTNTE